MRRWHCLALFIIGLSVRPAAGQIFTSDSTPPGETAPNLRFLVAAYYTQWQNPYRILVGGTSLIPTPTRSAPRMVSQTVRLTARTPASPLVEGRYSFGRPWGWSAGAWYNPVRGERLRKVVRFVDAPDVTIPLDLKRDATLMDFYVRYSTRRGLAAQLGYYRERGTVRGQANPGSTPAIGRQDYTLVSWDFWLAQQIERQAFHHPTALFIEAGYHPSAGLNHAVSLLGGTTISVNQRLRLSSSVWLFDLSHPSTRITAGLGCAF
jgi:hypothetical protein